MRVLTRTLVMHAILAVLFSSELNAATRLAQPNWDDASLRAELERIERARSAGLESSSPFTASALPVKLPILGLPLPDRSGSSPSLESLGNQPGAIYSYDEDAGNWYSQTSRGRDFTVIVTGSRLIEDDAGLKPLAKDEISFQFITEDGRRRPTEVIASFMRYDVRYGVIIACDREGDPKCSKEQAARSTINNALRVLGGQK